MSEEKCGNCDFYLPADECTRVCRRYPPVASVGNFPTVKSTDWCGEHFRSAGSYKEPKAEKSKDTVKKLKTGFFKKKAKK